MKTVAIVLPSVRASPRRTEGWRVALGLAASEKLAIVVVDQLAVEEELEESAQRYRLELQRQSVKIIRQEFVPIGSISIQF